ncbi:hypothetical protein AB0G74_05560 [Streptomyces sp. NPDC020875]|uniref:hypothetical protein n=1 Tax=Streptomyces sp. NPDC020875 TaxID=3154898 RepID=UPI00340249FA
MNSVTAAGATVVALPLPDQRSSFVLAGLTIALVALIWLLIRAIRRQGGFRPACRRLAWETRMTRRAFTEPFRARSAHRRRIRTLTSFLADPAVPARVDRVVDGAREAAGEGCSVPVVLVSADRAEYTAVIAGRDPRPARLPWHEESRSPGPRTRTVTASEIPAAVPYDPTLPLVLGSDRLSGATVIADWADGPPVISLEGDTRMVRAVVQALAAQLDLAARGPRVEIVRGVHPRWPGRDLDTVLDELENAGPSGEAGAATPPPVLVCWAPAGRQRERLAALCAEGRTRALVGGRFPGACWSLHTEPGGRIIGPGLGVDTESAALGRAVAAGVKRYRRRGTGWWDIRPEPAPVAEESGGGDDGDGDGVGPGPAAGPVAPARTRPRPGTSAAPATPVPPVEPTVPATPVPPVEPTVPGVPVPRAGSAAPEAPAPSAPPVAPDVFRTPAHADDFAEPGTGPTAPPDRPTRPRPPTPYPAEPPAEPVEPPGSATRPRRPGVSAASASRTPSERTPEQP